tara:strand:- start:2442 stop:3893 length:1452 start_codon:yes stop_codon:yes gene_type:complete
MGDYKNLITKWQPVIGLEIHLQLSTKTKMFSSCEWGYGKSPNSLTCPLTMAYPGTLPVVNQKAVEKAVMVGKALNCKINNYSQFSRKHYFYPDLPKGYQISQYDKPICGMGYLDIENNSKMDRINITRAHLEEDAGKFLHSDENVSLIDYNRAGAPLVEIVTEPEFRDPELVDSFLKTLKNRMEFIGVSDCNMEKGNFRIDLNVSIMRVGESNFGVRREIKNLNSFRSVNKAIKYEVKKQAEIIESGRLVKQSTMIWDESTNSTKITREKEDAHDYRYFPEPDLDPLYLSESTIKRIIKNMPELPDELALRLKKKYKISSEGVSFLVSDKYVAIYFEQVLEYITEPNLVLNWIKTNIMKILNRDKITIQQFYISPEKLGQLLDLLNSKRITKESANKIFDLMLLDDVSAIDLMNDNNLEVSTNEDELHAIIKNVIEIFPKEHDRYKNGEEKLIKFFMGQSMKKTKGKYPPNLIIEELNKLLND